MKKLISIFNHTLVVIPLGTASFLALVYLLGGWGPIFPNLTPEHFLCPKLEHWVLCLLALALMGLIVFCALKLREKIQGLSISDRAQSLLSGLEIFAIAFIFRFALIFIFQDTLQPYSDFFRTWQIASGNLDDYLKYYTMFPDYLNFSLYETVIFNMFGGNYAAVLYINVILSSLTALLITCVAHEANLKGKIPFVAGLIYALMPANVAYVTTGTEEFLTIFFNMAGVWFLLRAMQKPEGGTVKCLHLAFAGILLGIGASFKPFAVVIITAFVMTIAARAIIKDGIKMCKNTFNSWIKVLLAILIVLSPFYATYNGILKQTGDYYGLNLSNNTSFISNLLVGLNTEGEGQIHLGSLSHQYWDTYKETQDAELADEVAKNLLTKDLSENWQKLPKHFAKKMIWAWQDDVRPLSYLVKNSGVVANTPLEKVVLKFCNGAGFTVTQVCYFAIMTAAAIGAFVVSRRKTEVNFGVEMLELIIFGYFVMVFIIEAQSRYKCLVMPFVCIIAAIGVKFLWGKCKAHHRMKSD